MLASSQGEAERAALLLGAAEGLLQEVGAPGYNFYDTNPSVREHFAVEARTVLGDEAFEEAQERGREMDFEQAVEYALAHGKASPE